MQREPWGNDEYYKGGVFLPPEREVLQRASHLRWLLEQGFDEAMIRSVMDFDMPSFKTVEQMVEKYGTLLTRKKLDPFLIKVEYYGIGPIPEDEETDGETSE